MKSFSEPKHELPAKVEGLLATLAMLYARKKEQLLQQIVVNAIYSVKEGYDYDNLDGGQWGHLIRLAIPADLFENAMDDLTTIQDRIALDINRIAKCPHESISAVTVELAATTDIVRWREKSGALLPITNSENGISDAADRLWEKGYFRAFLSHKTEYKAEAARLKSSLFALGITAFVAHEDIEPSRAWQDDIESALSTMDACIALLTNTFHDSNWTDQEVGIAIGRGVPIVAVRLGRDPYGFIGRIQGVAGMGKSSDAVADEVMRFLLRNERLKQKMGSSLVLKLENAQSYAQANSLMDYISEVQSLIPEWIDRLEAAPKRNSQVRDAHRVQACLAQVVAKLRGKVTQ